MPKKQKPNEPCPHALSISRDGVIFLCALQKNHQGKHLTSVHDTTDDLTCAFVSDVVGAGRADEHVRRVRNCCIEWNDFDQLPLEKRRP